MQYRGALTVPADTPETDPASLTLAVCYGDLRRIVVCFPAGHAGLVDLQVFYRGRQIIPTTPGSTFRGDDLVIDLPETYPLHDPPFELILLGWSSGSTYEHTIYTIFYVDAPLVIQSSILDGEQIGLPAFED